MKVVILSLFLLAFAFTAAAQQTFPEKCLGVWTGTMEIFSRGELKDKVDVRLTVAKTDKPTDFTWKTEYLSKTQPQTKDYILRVLDAAKGLYVTDEGGGVLINEYLFGDKMFSMFEVQGVVLTATSELRGDELIFEVTAGKKAETAGGVASFTVNSLQRVVFKRKK